MVSALATTNKSTHTPFLRFKPYGKPITNIYMDFILNSNNSSEIKLGESYVQVIDEQHIPGNLLDYLTNIGEEYDGREDRLKNMIDILKYIEYRKDPIKGKLAFLHLVYIFEQFRKKKLSIPLMTLVIHALKNMDVDYVLLQPWPVELSRYDKDFEKEKNRIEKIYLQHGFIKRIVNKDCYMFLKLNKDLS